MGLVYFIKKLQCQKPYFYYILGVVLAATLASCNPLGVDSEMGKSLENNNNNVPTTGNSYPPVISRVIPDIGDVVGGTSLSVRGAYFENGTKVYIGNAECPNTQFVAASEIQCVSPPNAAVGHVDVKVVNPNADEYTLNDGYEYIITALTITGPNSGVDFTTAERGQMVHGTCTRNITSLLSSIGTFIDDNCSDGTWSLQTYSLTSGVNSFIISGTTPDAEASASDSINITYTPSVGSIQIDNPNGGVDFSTNVQTQTIYGTCSNDVVSLSSTLGLTFSDSDCSDGTWALIPFMMSLGVNNFVISGQDGSGNPVSDSISITYDNVAPLLLITAPHFGTDFITSNISQTVSGVCGTDVVGITTSLGGFFDSNCADGTWSLAPYALSPGANTFTITAYDEASNPSSASITITYDDANYSLDITAPNNGLDLSTNVLSQTISGTCTIGVTGLSSTLGTFADANCSDGVWSLDLYNLVGGTNTFTVSGLTPAGNVVSDTIVITYDIAAPSVAITAPHSGSSFDTGQQVQAVSGTCSTDVVNITTSNGYFADSNCSDGTWSLTPTVLNSGINTFTITAYDNAGNHSNASITIIYDDVIATLQVTAPNSGNNFTTNVQSQTVSGTCTTDVTNLSTNLGSFADSDCSDGTWSLNAVSLNPGDNTFTIQGDDNLSNHLTATIVINYDAVPPTLSITSPNAGADFTTNVLVQTVSGSCGTDVVSMTTSLGNFADSNCSDGTWSLNAKVLQVGVNTFNITAYDAAGNFSTASISITYDDVPAQLDITAPNGGLSFVTNSQLQSISGTCTTDVSGLTTTQGTFADNDCSDGIWSLTPYSLSNGLNTIQISGHDNMSNVLSSSINITYDPFAPAVSILLPTNSGSYTTHSIIETVSGTCSTDVVSMTTSNGAFEHMDCSTSGTWSLYPFLLTQGDNLFDIMAFDLAGNFSNSTLTITYNYVPSSLRVTGPNNGLDFITNVQSQTVHGTCSDDMVNIGTTLGVLDTSNCAISGEWWLKPYVLAAGGNTFTISGKDYLGNTLTDSITITYDTSAPTIAITAPNSGIDFSTGQQVQTISGTCSSDVTSITTNNSVLISSDCANTGTWSSGSYVLASGVNTFTATAHNIAGNTSSATITITYNYAPSSLKITSPNNGLSFTTNVLSQTIHGTCSTDMVALSTTQGTLADGDCTNGTWSLSPYDLALGPNTFTISGKDYLGNTLTSTTTITYDTSVPSVAITSPNGGANFTTAQQAQTVSGTCSSDVVSITTSKGSVLDADCIGTGTWHLFPYVLTVGANTFNIIATNSAGTSSNATITITYDNNTYSLHITNPNGGTNFTTNVQSQTVSGTCTAGITGLTSTLGTFADSNCTDGTWSLNPFSLSGGVNTFTISGTDPASNPVSATIAITYDTTPPNLSILAPNGGSDLSTYTLVQQISGSCSSDAINLQTTKGSFADSNCSDGTWSLNDAVMSTGVNTFTISATDAAGNPAIKTIHITYYDTPAFIHVSSPVSPLYTNNQVQTVSGTCSHEVTNLSANTGTWTGSFTDSDCSDGTWSLHTTTLAGGLNTITVSGKDAVNNTVSASVNIYYDTLPPTLSITAPNAGADLTTKTLVQTVSGLCGSDVTSITTSLGTFADSNCLDGNWSLNPAVMSEGLNTFTITAYDAAGNFTTATINITFDDVPPTAPSVTATSPTTDTTPTWSWTAGHTPDDGNGNFRYKLDDPDLSTGATPTTNLNYTSGVLADGVHTLYVQERDIAGNWSASGSFAVTVQSCNSALSWGRNINGQLGMNVALPWVTTPAAVPSLSGITKVVGGGGAVTADFSIARKSDGTVWSWGNNDSGQLGIGTYGTQGIPQQILGLTNISDVCAGASYAIALDTGGTVWAWGLGTSNQMGDTTAVTKLEPVKVSSLPSGITAINTSQGSSHALAIAPNGTVWAWGLNTSGELGTNNATATTSAVNSIDTYATTLSVNSVVVTSATTITVTTNTNHGLNVGYLVTMAGWSGVAINGTYAVATVTDPTHFTYTTAGASGSPAGGTIVTSMPSLFLGVTTVTGDGATVTVTTSANHNLIAGQSVVMTGWTGGSGTWDGTYAITYISATQFSYSSSGNGTATGGTLLTNGAGSVPGHISNVIAVASGTSHSVALKGDGTVWAWGLGTSGQLGNGASLTEYSPQQVQITGGAYLTGITAIAAGTNFNIARKSDGTLWSWGLGTGGQLGDNTIVTKNYAVQVKSTEVGGLLTNVSNNISAGGLHAVVVKADHTVWTWGTNTNFQLGDGTVTLRNQAQQLAGITDATQANAAFDFTVLTNGSTVKALGNAQYAQLGISEINKLSPTPIYGFETTPVLDIDGGVSHTILVKSSDGTVWTAGSNASSQIGEYLPVSAASGTGSVITITTTVAHGLSSGQSVTLAGFVGGAGVWNGTFVVTVLDSTRFTCPTTGTGSPTLTNATVIATQQKNILSQVRGVGNVGYLTGVSKVAAGSISSHALKSGNVYSWGTNTNGQLGNGSAAASVTPVQVFDGFSKILNISSVVVTNATTITVMTTDHHNLGRIVAGVTPYVVVSGYTGATGVNGTFAIVTIPNTTSFTYTTAAASGTPTGGTIRAYLPSYPLIGATVAGAGTTVTVTSAASNLTVGQRITMAGWSGGTGTYNGTYEIATAAAGSFTYTAPTTVSGAPVGGTVIINSGAIVSNVSGDGSTVTVTTTGNHNYVAGQNIVMAGWSGGTGIWNGTFPIASVLSSTQFTYASTGNGIPTGGTTSSTGYISNVANIQAGTSTVVARKNDGTVWAWGLGTSGQMGNNAAVNYYFPVQVLDTDGITPLTGISAISMRTNHVLALRNSGTVIAWGLNTSGQLGDNTIVQRNAPVAVMNLASVTSISAGVVHSLAATSDGAAWGWGVNSNYQLGDGTVTQRNQPVRVLGINGVSTVQAGGLIHSYAIKTDGTLWAWGASAAAAPNNYGYIGDGTNGLMRPFPVQVDGFSHISKVEAGDTHTLAIQNCSY